MQRPDDRSVLSSVTVVGEMRSASHTYQFVRRKRDRTYACNKIYTDGYNPKEGDDGNACSGGT